jgi:phosphate starvation-inducible membrane PsiE
VVDTTADEVEVVRTAADVVVVVALVVVALVVVVFLVVVTLVVVLEAVLQSKDMEWTVTLQVVLGLLGWDG